MMFKHVSLGLDLLAKMWHTGAICRSGSATSRIPV
jgi:hypothetical protein